MKKFFKQLFCKHRFIWFHRSPGCTILHTKQWYYDDYEIGVCSKCSKEI